MEEKTISAWLKKRVNFSQTPEERRAKYAYAQKLGASQALASRMRDWRWTNIQKPFVPSSQVLTKRQLWTNKASMSQKQQFRHGLGTGLDTERQVC